MQCKACSIASAMVFFFFSGVGLLGYFCAIILGKVYTNLGFLTNSEPTVTSKGTFQLLVIAVLTKEVGVNMDMQHFVSSTACSLLPARAAVYSLHTNTSLVQR